MYLLLAVIAVAASVVGFRRAPVNTLVLAAPGTVHAGSTVDLPVTLKTSSKDLSALEWQVSTPPDMAFVALSSLNEKTVRCNKQHCMLYGGQSPLSSGVIAKLTLHVPGTPVADVSVGLHDVLGATNDGVPIKIGGASLKLEVQP